MTIPGAVTRVISLLKSRAWLERETLLTMLSQAKSKRKIAYLDFVCQGEPQKISTFYAMKKLPILLGSEAFKDWIKNRFADSASQKDLPDARILATTPQEIITEVCAYYGLEEPDLGSARLRKTVARYCHLPCAMHQSDDAK